MAEGCPLAIARGSAAERGGGAWLADVFENAQQNSCMLQESLLFCNLEVANDGCRAEPYRQGD
jgi:hypothetical protein